MIVSYLRVVDGVAVEAWTAPDDKTPADCFTTDIAKTFVPAVGGQVGWTYANGVFSAPVAPVPTLVQFASTLVEAASAACAALTTEVVPDQVHQNGYVNAAAMVGPGAVVPTAEPTKSAFAALAASFGAEPAAFATMVVAIAAVSWQLQAAQVTVAKAAVAAKTAADLSVALSTFEATIAAIVVAITAAGVTVTAPAPIVIAGLSS